MRTVAPAISAFGPPPWPSGTAAWPSADPSASESVSQRLSEGLPNPRGYSRAPSEIRIVPVKRPFSASPTARGPPLRRPHGLQSRQPACSRRVAVPSRLPLPAAGPPVEVAAAAAACCTIAPTISAFGPLHGRQAPPPGRQRAARRQSRPLSGPALPNPRGYSRVPPEIRIVPVNAVFSAPLAPRGPPLRRPHGLQSRQPACSRRVAVSEPTAAAGRRTTGRGRGSGGSMRTIAPTISAFGPLHGRQAPPLGRQRAARRQSRPLSGPQRPFQTCGGTSGGTPGNPNSARQTPFLSVADCARPAAPDRSGVRMDCNRGNLRAVVGSLFRADCRCRPPDHRSRSWQQRQHAHHRAHDLGHSAPFTVVRRRRPTASGPLGVRVGRSAALRGPSEPAGVLQGTPGNQNSARQRRSQRHTRTAGPARFAHACSRTSNNNPTPALRRRRGTLRHITASLTQIRAPSMQFPQPRWCTRHPRTGHPGTLWPERRYPLRTPFARTVRLIQKSHPAILAVTGSDHSPVAFISGMGGFSPEYAATDHSATPRTYPHIHSATTPPPRTPPPLPPPFHLIPPGGRKVPALMLQRPKTRP